MRTDVLLPQVELTMELATVARWLVAVGDRVRAEQALVEVETQKATSDVPSPSAGYVRKLCVKEGETVGGKALLCILTDSMDEPVDGQESGDAPSAAVVAEAAVPVSAARLAVKASPAARKLAKDLGVDLARATGTGPEGRITEDDVRRSSPVASGASEAWTPLPRTRLALIAQMQRSVSEIPQIQLRREIDVTPLGVKRAGLTFTHRLIFAVAAALKRHTALRTLIEGERVKIAPVNIAVAMDSTHGLVAPIIVDADRLSLEQIAETVKSFRERADGDALRRNELIGDAPFAISNLGMLGVDQFDALVFHGQTAVLSVGKSFDRGGRKLAWLGLSLDHRVVDGAEGARFLQTLQEEILAR